MNAYIVDETALAENIEKIKEQAGGVPIYGVIKGNGYGLGLIPLTEALWNCGITRFAVTEVSEVRALREHGFAEAEILMLRETGLESELSELLELGAVATVGCRETADKMETVAEAQGKKFPCHVKIDTGMGRYGFFPEALDAIEEIYRRPGLEVRGIYTHFHSAFCSEKDTKAQFDAFQGVLSGLEARGIAPGVRHCCNSSAFVRFPEMYLDAVRIGSAFLGRLGMPEDIGLKRLGYCQSSIEVLRELPKGYTVGYGAAWKAKRPTKIAVCGIGNFHGFGAEKGNDIFRFRDCVRGGLGYVKAFLKKKAYYGEINGKQARVLGHIGMVQTVLDVTDIPCGIGDTIRFEINPLLMKNMDVLYTTAEEIHQ